MKIWSILEQNLLILLNLGRLSSERLRGHVSKKAEFPQESAMGGSEHHQAARDDCRMTEEALLKSQRLLKKTFASLRDALFIIDAETVRILDCNPAASEIFGYSREELLGQTTAFLHVSEAASQEFRKHLYDCVGGKGFLHLPELQMKRKNGLTFFTEHTVMPLEDDLGTRMGWVSVVRDITERKRAEAQMAALQEQFRQSQKIEAVGRLAGGIAHDFNNLLTVIQGYCQISLSELREQDPLKPNLLEIEKASRRAASLTRQLLAFSRRQIMEMRVVDLNTILLDLDKMLRRILGEDIELVTRFAEDLERAKVDPGQIEQVILNLAVNARDAMPRGGKLIMETANEEGEADGVWADPEMRKGRYAVLSISDTGCGMAQEVKEQIFEPFFTTKDKGKGTGLGLSTVYGIVKQSGGEILVQSELGKGTTFKIYLPRAEEASNASLRRDEAGFLPGGRETILLAEDEPSIRDLAVRVLQRQGYTVLEAANGKEALSVADAVKGKIHLLLTDVVMPEMGGKELAEKLKGLRPEMKVLFATGYTSNAIVHHGILDPSTALLQKPFSIGALTRKVRDVLDG
jgi:two-component system, cell cycle sensor histidine kinase and response regulator CckA